MGRGLRFARSVRPGRSRPGGAGRERGAPPRHRALQLEPRLAAADQLQIDLGQQLGIEQRAVLLPLRAVDPEVLTAEE